PPIWVPSQGSKETIDWAAHPDHRYTYLQTFSPAKTVQKYLQSYRDTAEQFGYEATDSQLGWAVPIYVADTDEQAIKEAREPFELFRNRLLKMPFEMLLPPGYSSRDSLKRIMAAKAMLSQELTIEMAIDMGMIVCGSPATVRQQLESHWNDMHFDNLLTMLHFGNLSEELTRRNMDLFAKEVLPNLQAMKRAAPAQASA
ncbi:MAG TPA: LLM class flavin-dependent oxidoreductase, partial [Pusillimonas sp.]|nr:LLM class flavin-dependent oxidoreductase [Pusillimonas sp.]